MKSNISFFNINWLSEYDGPGKRLVLFLQGCHLDCVWCHSPHSQLKASPLLYFDSLCQKCQRCKDACRNNVHCFNGNEHLLFRDNCTLCGQCIEACPQSSNYKHNGALILPTRKIDVSSLFETIEPHLKMLGDEGGITFSGGEPLLQSEALALLAHKCKLSGIHTALETSGTVPIHFLENIFSYIDTWLIGIRLDTGRNKPTKDSFESKTRSTLDFLTHNGITDIIARYPVIPGYTTTEYYLNTTLQILMNYNISRIDILPHNPESSHYYKAMNLPFQIDYDASQAERSYKYVSNFLLTKLI